MPQRVTDFNSPITTDHFKHPVDRETARKLCREINGKTSAQAVAATLTDDKIAEGPGRVTSARVLVGGALPGAGESMVIDVLKNGVSILSATLTINNADEIADKWYALALKTDGTPVVLAGDLIRITRTYVAGGTPTPMTNTLVKVDIEYDAHG